MNGLSTAEIWNEARERYFRSTSAPVRDYKVDGVKGEIIDVHVYTSPRADLVLVIYGETYFNTTGWDVHVALLRTNDNPVYPANVYICPNGSNFAADWLDEHTLGIFYPAGYYPDERDSGTTKATHPRQFQYEKRVGETDVKFIAADRTVMEAKESAMAARELKHSPVSR